MRLRLTDSRETPTVGSHRASLYARVAAIRPITWGVAITALALLPWLGLNAYWLRELEAVAITGLLVSSFNTILGHAGEFAFSQLALYGVGAYVSGYFAARYGIHDILLSLLLSIASVAIVGFVSGIPGLRIGGWSLAMLSFFLVLIIPNCVDLLSKYTGGENGILGIPQPTFLGLHLSADGFYVFVAVVTGLWFAALRNFIDSPHGNAFLVLKQSPVLAESLGISVFRLKVMAYTLCSVPCAIAGTLLTFQNQFVAPASFGLSNMFTIIAAGVVGGSESVLGAVIGTGIIVLVLQRISSLQQYYVVVFGAFLVFAGLVFNDGVMGLIRAAYHQFLVPRVAQRPTATTDDTLAVDTGSAPVPGRLELRAGLLEVKHVSKSFGGLQALDDVSLEVRPGRVTALIGPNGSGKTTLLNLICGFYRCNYGSISLDGHEVSNMPPYGVARTGIVRTFQTPLVPRGMTSREFVEMGRYSTHKIRLLSAILRLPSFKRTTRQNLSTADQLMEELGISHAKVREVTSLPLGTRRLVEVARSLSAEGQVFLFDEAASGLHQDDIARLERAIRIITDAGGSVLLVEHNFPLVLKVADDIHVLANGSLIASGPPKEIARNPKVLEEYVGRKLSRRLEERAQPT